jgi:hypothetical protein
MRGGSTLSSSGGSTARKLDAQIDAEIDYLDVPAFLRSQAD